MSKAIQTRIIKVNHPVFKQKILFEAYVRIINIDTGLVKKVTGVKIEYELQDN